MPSTLLLLPDGLKFLIFLFLQVLALRPYLYHFVAKGLLVEMFEKRKVLSFRYSDALALLKEDENRLKILIEKEIIHQNGNFSTALH